MAQLVNKNTFSSTYRDDFADSDGYYRILFNSGKKLQARELTQMQTIIQKQIERMGNNLFADNSVIKQAAAQVDNNYQFIRLNTTNEPISDPQSLVGAIYTGVTSQVVFRVDEVVEAGVNPVTDPLTLYGTYTSTENSSLATDQQAVAQPNEVMQGTNLPNIRVENSAQSTGFGSRFLSDGGIYYSKGFFIFADKQEKIISKYTNTPTVVVGFKRIDEVVTSADDTALFDNQGASPNLTAPGADRFRIRLELSLESEMGPTDTFIRKAKVVNGKIVATSPVGNEYNKPREFVAQRIKENSGDYIVKPFNLRYADDSDDNFLLAQTSSGVAVVNGYRASVYTSDTPPRVRKARSTVNIADQFVPISFGNFFELDSVPAQMPDITNSVGFEKQNVRDGADYGGATIGTCFVRFIQEDGAGYRAYITNLVLNSGSGIGDIGSIGTGANAYFNINQNSRDNGPFNNSGTLNSLIFPLPNRRPENITNADITVQRQFRFTPTGSTFDITTDNSTEIFLNEGDWLITDLNGDIPGATITLQNVDKTARIGGLSAGVSVAVTAFVRKSNETSRSKTKTSANKVFKVITDGVTNQQFINLHKPDIIEVTHIEDPNDSTQSYLGNFTLDDGRKDNFYDNGRLFLTGALPPNATTTGLRIRWDYFQHEPGKSFFSKNSYDGEVDYKDIPTHTFQNGEQIFLADALDFRPTVDSDGDFEVANGGSTNEIPDPATVIDLDVSYYLPRIDKVIIDQNGKIRVIPGASSFAPSPPETPKGTMELFKVKYDANTLDNNDITITRIDHKRYTMSQINLLEKRLGRLEDAVSLSLLENKAADIVEFDANGDPRLKSGFIVDNFTSHALTDKNNSNLRSSMDFSSGLLFPQNIERVIDLEYDSDTNNPSPALNVALRGGFIVPRYDTELYMENEYASDALQVNPFQVNNFNGTIQLSPSSDNWYETRFPFEKVVNYQGSEILSDGAYQWNNHEWNWLGKDLESLQTGDKTNTTASTSGRTTTTSWNVVENIFIQEDFVENRLVRTESIPKVRARLVRFKATGLRPNAKHYAFFDNVSVDAWVKEETFTSTWRNDFAYDSDYGTEYINATGHPSGSQQLTSDEFGVIEGSFFIPATSAISFLCGNVKFELKDVTGSGNENYLSRAVTNYTAEGTLKLYEEVWTSTRYIEIEGDQSVYTAPVVTNNSGGGDDGYSGGNDNFSSPGLDAFGGPGPNVGDANSCGGNDVCVIATHATQNNVEGFSLMDKAKAEIWCEKKYHGTWYGEAFRRGYRYLGNRAIERGEAHKHYQEFKDFVAYGRGLKKGLKPALNYYFRTAQFFAIGLFTNE